MLAENQKVNTMLRVALQLVGLTSVYFRRVLRVGQWGGAGRGVGGGGGLFGQGCILVEAAADVPLRCVRQTPAAFCW